MDIEQADNPLAEPATKEPAHEQDASTEIATDQETDGGEVVSEAEEPESPDGDDPEGDDDDAEDVEFEGEKYRLPRKLKDALMRQADYTRKTQEAAEIRRAAEAREASLQDEREQLQQAREFQSRHMKELGQLAAIDQQLERYQRLDWSALIDSDPIQAQKVNLEYQQLRDQRNQTEQRIRQADEQALAEQWQRAAKLNEENRRKLTEYIPDWSDTKAREVRDFAIRQGLPARQVDSVVDARQIAILHKAYLYDQLASKRQQPKPKPAPATPVKRVKPAAAKASKNPDDMSDEEWLALRRRQLSNG